MKNFYILLIVIALLFGVVIGVFFQKNRQVLDPDLSPNSGALSVAPPSQTADQDFQELTSLNGDTIRLRNPQVEGQISSPLLVSGEARGSWFFEATFPVTLTNWDGLIIAEGNATADGEWMTEDYVPFTAELTFTQPDYSDRGSLILQKANPSGLPENDDSLEITVSIKN